LEIFVARIGDFDRKTPDEEIFEGHVHTLALDIPLRFVPNPDTDSGGAVPNLIGFSGVAEVAAAWRREKDDGTVFYSVRIDDPSLPGPINAALFRSRLAGHRYELMWHRPAAVNGGIT
jgi:uncharacterized protein (DUF736 family)